MLDPLTNHVLLQVLPKQETSSIIRIKGDPIIQCRVIRSGPDAKDVKAGDFIHCPNNSGLKVTKDKLILRESKILGKFTN